MINGWFGDKVSKQQDYNIPWIIWVIVCFYIVSGTSSMGATTHQAWSVLSFTVARKLCWNLLTGAWNHHLPK